MTEAPDRVALHGIARCTCCGGMACRRSPLRSLAQAAAQDCTACGKLNRGSFPEGIKRDGQYGPRLKSLCVYLQNYHMLPYARCAELITDLTGHGIATGSLSNFQGRCFADLEGYEHAIRERLLRSPVLHADETGIRLNGKNSWMHVVSNGAISLFPLSRKTMKTYSRVFNWRSRKNRLSLKWVNYKKLTIWNS